MPIAGAIRTNIAVVEQDGTTTKLNEPGATLSDHGGGRAARPRSTTHLRSRARAGWSRPAACRPARPTTSTPGSPRPRWRSGVPVAIDTSGPALAAAIDAGATVVKPNLEELEEILGRDLVTVGDVIDAAANCAPRGCKDLLVSMGGHGALLITAEGSWWAGGPPLVPRSTVGAGDCTLSGYLHTVGSPDRATCRGGGLGAGRLPASR